MKEQLVPIVHRTVMNVTQLSITHVLNGYSSIQRMKHLENINVKIQEIAVRNIMIQLDKYMILSVMVRLVMNVKMMKAVIKIKATNVQIGLINHQIHHYLMNHKGLNVLQNVILLIQIQLIMKNMIQCVVELLELIATKKT